MVRRLLVAILVLAIVVLSYLLISKIVDITQNGSKAEDILTVSDLDNPDADLAPDTSDASVDSLAKELQAQIDRQIAAKENPYKTVDKLAGVLANTTNKTRQYQLTDFVQDFLAKHEDSLWFGVESGMPDQAQVNYWKSELYAKLVYNYQFMMLDKFTDSDGKPIDTTKEQLKYIELYLKLAYDPESQSRVTDEYKTAPLGYTYYEAENFLKLRESLAGEGQNE